MCYVLLLGPLMVCYSGPFTKLGNVGDVREMTHEGKVFELRCLMLAKNDPEIIDVRSDYLVVL